MTEASRTGEVLVIIPTFNEAQNIESIVSRLRRSVPEAHVLVVDDNSPDGTGELVDALVAQDDHVHVLHRRGKEGLGAAYLAGFHWGLERGYGVLVEHDADNSHQPEQLPSLLAALEHADMVKGSRWVKGGSVVNWPWTRKFLSRGGSLYIRLMLGMPYRDITGGFNAFRADALDKIIDLPIDRSRLTYQLVLLTSIAVCMSFDGGLWLTVVVWSCLVLLATSDMAVLLNSARAVAEVLARRSGDR